jgi:hypothetical protein
MSTPRLGLASLLLAGTLMVVPSGPLPGAQVTVDQEDTPESREIRADELLQEANSYGDQRAMWDYASSLYRKSASLREEGDLEAVHALRMAARLAYYGGFKSQAIQDLERAAEHALAGGDLVTAAHTFVDAAWVSKKLGSDRNVDRFARRGLALTESPLIATSDRLGILDRLEAGGTSVAWLDERGNSRE